MSNVQALLPHNLSWHLRFLQSTYGHIPSMSNLRCDVKFTGVVSRANV
jgi:hypothetical protein